MASAWGAAVDGTASQGDLPSTTSSNSSSLGNRRRSRALRGGSSRDTQVAAAKLLIKLRREAATAKRAGWTEQTSSKVEDMTRELKQLLKKLATDDSIGGRRVHGQMKAESRTVQRLLAEQKAQSQKDSSAPPPGSSSVDKPHTTRQLSGRTAVALAEKLDADTVDTQILREEVELAEAKARETEELEKDVQQLAEMTTDLATLTQAGDDALASVEENTSDTAQRSKDATVNLAKATKLKTSAGTKKAATVGAVVGGALGIIGGPKGVIAGAFLGGAFTGWVASKFNGRVAKRGDQVIQEVRSSSGTTSSSGGAAGAGAGGGAGAGAGAGAGGGAGAGAGAGVGASTSADNADGSATDSATADGGEVNPFLTTPTSKDESRSSSQQTAKTSADIVASGLPFKDGW